jgi:alcohol dehydrogenase class IV
LPVALEVNREAALSDLAELGRRSTTWLRGHRDLPSLDINASHEVAARHFTAVIRILTSQLNVPHNLTQLGVRREQLSAIVKSSRGNSMDGNPREISDDELLAILDQMFCD